jgi:hypothetical protein
MTGAFNSLSNFVRQNQGCLKFSRQRTDSVLNAVGARGSDQKSSKPLLIPDNVCGTFGSSGVILREAILARDTRRTKLRGANSIASAPPEGKAIGAPQTSLFSASNAKRISNDSSAYKKELSRK